VPFDGLAAELLFVSIGSVAANRIATPRRTFARVNEEKNVAIEADRELTMFLLCRRFSIFSPDWRTPGKGISHLGLLSGPVQQVTFVTSSKQLR